MENLKFEQQCTAFFKFLHFIRDPKLQVIGNPNKRKESGGR